jgi:uncharacterized membrane protein
VRRAARLGAATLLLVLAAIFPARASADDGGWTISSFDAFIQVQSDGRVLVTETLAVDFGFIERHGIFRDIPVQYAWPQGVRKIRVYEVQVLSVTDAAKKAWKYESYGNGANVEIKIGDPDRTVTGRQTYVITYVVKGALNSFSDHDELYWNATGNEWPALISRATATVRAPAAASQTACFVGPVGSTARCTIQSQSSGALYTSPRALIPGEGLTVVFGLRKGVVPEPKPILQDRPRELDEFFDVTPLWLALAAFVAIGGVVAVFWRWYTAGRDEREHETIVPEFEPPEKARPAEIGVLVDESADTLDVTATIVDLAVRGYLTITEIPKEGLFGSRDWTLARKKPADDGLLEYEGTILGGLFTDGDEVKLSALRQHFYTTLAAAERQLYDHTTARAWFAADPSRVRVTYAVAGVGFVVLAIIVTGALGFLVGGGLVGLAGLVPSIAMIAAAPVMPRKTKIGAELYRRALGFKQYMVVAEKDRQAFAEKEHIFADYLPYAIVYGCVDQWAKAFEGIDLKAVTSGWYVGNQYTMFSAMNMSRDLSSFSSVVSTAIASTPGGSGSSGFSGGGSSGGGGGGGGGGSW